MKKLRDSTNSLLPLKALKEKKSVQGKSLRETKQ